MGFILLAVILWIAIFLVPLWKIFGKAGFHPMLALISLVPGFGSLVCLAILAFADWPAAADDA